MANQWKITMFTGKTMEQNTFCSWENWCTFDKGPWLQVRKQYTNYQRVIQHVVQVRGQPFENSLDADVLWKGRPAFRRVCISTTRVTGPQCSQDQNIAFQTPDDQTKSRCHRNYQWVIVIWIEWFMTIYGSWANTTWSCFTDSCLTPVGARRRSIRYVSARSSFLKDVRPSQPRRSLRAHMDPVKNRHEAKNQPLNRKLGMKLSNWP